MISETAMEPQTPNAKIQESLTLKSIRRSPIRNIYKVTISGFIRRKTGRNARIMPKLSNFVLVNTFSKLNFKHVFKRPSKKDCKLVTCDQGFPIKPL